MQPITTSVPLTQRVSASVCRAIRGVASSPFAPAKAWRRVMPVLMFLPFSPCCTGEPEACHAGSFRTGVVNIRAARNDAIFVARKRPVLGINQSVAENGSRRNQRAPRDDSTAEPALLR